MSGRLINPGKVGLPAIEIAGDGIEEDVKCCLSPELAGLPYGQDSLRPAVPLLAGSALHHSSPEHGKAQRPLRPVVGRLNSLFNDEEPQVPEELFQMAGKPARIILSISVLGDQTDHSRIPHARLSPCGRSFGPGDQALELAENSLAKPGQVRIFPLGQPLGSTHQMGEAGLLFVHPVHIHPVAITDQDARPLIHQLLEGFLGTVSRDLVESHKGIDHEPEPHRNSVLKPGRLVNVIDLGIACAVSYRLINRLDGLGCSVNDPLYGSTADLKAEKRSAQGLHAGAAVAVRAGHVGNESGQPWPIARFMPLRSGRFHELAALGTAALHEQEVIDLDLDGGKLDLLMEGATFQRGLDKNSLIN